MSKTALVTGAASGIGKAAATGLAKQGYQVTLLVRNQAKGERAVRDIQAVAPTSKPEILLCDLASQASIRGAAAAFLNAHDKLDVLVNAAGVFMPERVVTEDGLEATFATNVVAYYLVTDLMTPALKRAAPSRVVNVSSRYGGAKIAFDDLQMERRKYSYLKSTPPTMLGRVLLTQAFSDRFKDSGVVVNAVHPGLVANTQLLNQTGGFFRWLTNRLGKSPEVGADTIVWLATAPEAGKTTGQLWHKRKPMKTPGQGSDADVRKRLWAECERLVRKPVPGTQRKREAAKAA